MITRARARTRRHTRVVGFSVLCYLATAVVATCGLASGAVAQIYRLAEFNTEQVRSLDRARTVVLLPGGVMEQHGPYLPSFTDGYMNEWWTERLAEAIVTRPGWTVVIFPLIPIGDGGANELGGRYVFPGTYGVRIETLRALYMDLATDFGEQGFRWIFVIHNHGSPLHNRALDQAGDYFRDTYGGIMVNLFGLEMDVPALTPPLSPEELAENGIDIHAGASETSRILFLRPDLVDPAVLGAHPQTARTGPDISSVAAAPGWPGYLGSPRLASAARGAQIMRDRADVYSATVLRILDGLDPRTLPRYADQALRSQAQVVEGSLQYDADVERRQRAWLERNPLVQGSRSPE